MGDQVFHITYFTTPEGVVSECEHCGPLGTSADKESAFEAGALHLTQVHHCHTTFEDDQ